MAFQSWTFGSMLVPEGRDTLALTAAAQGLPNLTSLTYGVRLRCEGGPARYIVVGAVPTATDGDPLNDGDVIYLSRAEALGFKAILSSAIAMNVFITRYRVGP